MGPCIDRFRGQGRGNGNIHGNIDPFSGNPRSMYVCMDGDVFVCVAPFPRPAWAKVNIREKIDPCRNGIGPRAYVWMGHFRGPRRQNWHPDIHTRRLTIHF
jgi:hypothetical protein